MILSKIESEQCEINSVKSKTFDRSFLHLLLIMRWEFIFWIFDSIREVYLFICMQKNLYVRNVRLKIQVSLINQQKKNVIDISKGIM